MKSCAIIIIALLCTSTFASNTFLGSNAKLVKTLKGIDNTEFGKNLLDTIALQLETEGAMDDIANLLRDMITELRRAQEEHDEAYAAKVIECNAEIADYEHRIEVATNNIQDATIAIKEYRGKKRDLEKSIATRETELRLLDEHEAQLRADRTRDAADFLLR